MGSPISFVVAEIVMQNVEEQTQASYRETLPLWLRYVYDTITAAPTETKFMNTTNT